MADVVFNGSATRKPVQQASVELVFDNADGRIGLYNLSTSAYYVFGDNIGTFTGRDALRCLALGVDAEHTSLGQVMTADPVCLGPRAQAMEALRLMHDGGFRHVPIAEKGRVIGVVSRYDFRADEHTRMNDETGYFENLR